MKKIAYFIIILLFASCEKEIIFDDLANSEEQLVLNCVANNISNIKVGVYKTAPVGKVDSSCLYVDADVELFEDGIFIGKLVYDTTKQINRVSPFYSLDYIPQPGHLYEIKVKQGTFSASGSFYLNNPVKLQQINLTLDTSNNDLKLDIKYKDPDTTNYYMLIAYFRGTAKEWIDFDTGEQFLTGRHYLSLFDPNATDSYNILNPEDEMEGYVLTDDNLISDYVIDDTKFNGKEVNLEYYAYLQDTILDWDSTITVALISLSPEAYKYFYTLYLYNKSQNNPFIEPVNVYTNVVGGLGAVVGTSADTLVQKIQISN